MGNSIWQGIKATRQYQRKKLLLKQLIGKEPWLKPDLSLPTSAMGGWRLYPTSLDCTSVVYSLGVGDDIELESKLLGQCGMSIHAFDPTPSTIKWIADHSAVPPGLIFHPWAVTAHDGVMTLYPRVSRRGHKSATMYTLVAQSGAEESGIQVPAYTIGTIMARLGHTQIDLLKIDIEGAEYAVLENLLASAVRPSQLLVEFHHRFAGIGARKTVEMVRRLRSCGYHLFAVSDNGREFSFLFK